MDSCSQISMDSEDSIPRNVYEEVIVDSNVQSVEPKDKNASDFASTSVNPKNTDVASESDAETDDEESESVSSRSSIPSPSVKAMELLSSTVIEKGQTPSSDEQKTANLKLVLKKSPEYQLVNASFAQGKSTSNNKIYLVSNSNTSQNYATAKYSVTASDAKASAVSVTSDKSGETNESLLGCENRDDLRLEVLKQANDAIKPIKTYGRATATVLAATSEQEVDADSAAAEAIIDAVENEFVSSETESKPSTPKIARELQQLQKTVNESKVLSEYINDSMGKSRKARKLMAKEGSPVLQPIRSRSRSRSKHRLDSPTDNVEKPSGLPSEERTLKRQNMRSQNSEFVQKHMKFLNSLQGDDASDNSDGETSITDGKSSSHSIVEHPQQTITKRELHSPPKEGWDMFCFKCHFGADLIACSKCIRSFHGKCVKSSSPAKTFATWVCPECIAIENSIKCSSRSKWSFSVDNLNQLLQFALKRMKQLKGFELFLNGFKDDEYPDFSKYIVYPVTLEMLQNNIEKKVYKCTEEFAVEAKWILHNCFVYFGSSSKITNFAKGILKVCRQEVTEIDTCPECYYNANTRKDWFVEVCSKPHMLLWAKLKGFPYWPAKSMGINGAVVNVRFFGDHDRAYVPIKECFLYSENDPNPPTKQNKKSIKECIKEVEIHIRKITAKFGSFVYPPFRTVYEPNNELQQLEIMIPGITESMKNAEKLLKPALTYKIVKTADNHLSIVRKEKDQVEDVLNVSPIPVNIPSPDDSEKVSKSRVKSTDSSQSSKEVSSSSGTAQDSAATPESLVEVKVVEKTVAPMKIQERIDTESTTKTYEIVPKTSDSEQTKVNSVILKRKSDNWNAVTATTHKKQKLVLEPPEEIVVSNKEVIVATPKTVPATSAANKPNQPILTTIKRKRSREDGVSKQKAKLDGDKIPPLAPLTPPFVISQSNATLPIHSSANCTLAPVPIVASSTVTVTITQSPALTSIASNDSPKNKSASLSLSAVLNFENSEISIQRLPKKQPAAVALPPNTQVGKEKTKTSAPHTNERDQNTKLTEVPKEIEKQKVNRSQETKTKSNAAKKTCELIPFTEIKIEKPDSQDTSVELVEVRSKTTTPEQPTSTNPNGNASSEELNIRPIFVKTEITSEDEELSNASRLEENGDTESGPSTSKPSDVKATAKILPQSHVASQKNAMTQNKSAGKPESKKQRARKSFPNKSNFNSIALASATNVQAIKRPAMPQSLLPQNNGMVYIPVDPKTSAVALQALTPTPTSSSSASSKAIVNSNALPMGTIPFSCNPMFAGNAMSTSMAPVPSTILTTSLQLPIVYSTISIPPMNGPTSNQQNAVQVTCSVQPNTPVTSEQHMLSGFVTPTLASAITDAIVKGPPKLMAKPAGPLRSDGDFVFPSEAGPVSKMLMENAHKMTDFFRSVIEETLNDMSKNQNIEAKTKLLELELEKMRYTHEKEIAELKHNTDLMLCEMRKSLENEKTRLVADTRKQCELERIRAVEEAKTKQWCAACGKEAQFYCCWNTSYCDYPCQQKHWARHMSACAQKDNNDANAQRVGVKISPYNMKDRQNKTKESAAQKLSPSTFIRAQFPAAIRNSVPTSIKRLIPLPTQTTPRYTLINGNESNWGLVPTPQFPRVYPTSSLIMSDSSNKSLSASPVNVLRTPKM